MICVSDVTKIYVTDGVRAVDDVSFTVKEGELYTLLGPSGCGKTTTLRCIAGLERANGGTIELDGVVVVSDRLYVPPYRRDIGILQVDHLDQVRQVLAVLVRDDPSADLTAHFGQLAEVLARLIDPEVVLFHRPAIDPNGQPEAFADIGHLPGGVQTASLDGFEADCISESKLSNTASAHVAMTLKQPILCGVMQHERLEYDFVKSGTSRTGKSTCLTRRAWAAKWRRRSSRASRISSRLPASR